MDSGERLPEAPSFNARAAVRYEWPLAGGARPFVQLDAARKGSMWNDLRVDHRILQPAYTIANLRVGFAPARGDWRAEAYVGNLSNERAIVFANYNTFSTLGQYDTLNQPRVFGLWLSYRYDKNDDVPARSRTSRRRTWRALSRRHDRQVATLPTSVS